MIEVIILKLIRIERNINILKIALQMSADVERFLWVRTDQYVYIYLYIYVEKLITTIQVEGMIY